MFTQIQAQSLSELYTNLLRQTSPLGSTQLPSLDLHLSPLSPTSSCKRGDVFELQGTAATGKTHFLYYILINCILPPTYRSVTLNGWGKSAVFIDADHKFNIQRFNQLLLSRAKRFLPLNSSDANTLAINCLDRLHIFRPTSSHQLAATIHHLPKYLATNLPDTDLGVLAVDSVTAFYWPDRYLLEQFRSTTSTGSSIYSHNHLNKVLASLEAFRRSHGPLILLSSWDLNPNTSSQNKQTEMTSGAPRSATDRHTQVLRLTHHINFSTPTVSARSREDYSHNNDKSTWKNVTRISGTIRTTISSKTATFSAYIDEYDMYTS